MAGGSIPGWIAVRGSWTAQSFSGRSAEMARAVANDPAYYRMPDGAYCFYSGITSAGELYQDVNVSGLATGIGAGNARMQFSAQAYSFDQKPPDTWRVVIEFRASDNARVVDSHDTGEQSSPGRWKEVNIERLVPRETKWIRIKLLTRRYGHGTKSNDAKFDALSLRLVSVPGRLPVPEDEALAGARARIEAAHSEEIKAAKTQPEKRAMAQTLLSRGLAETGDELLRYALLHRTIDVANESGSYDLASRAIDALGAQYEVNGMAMREAALDYGDRLAKSTSEKRLAAESWGELARLAVAQDDYDAAVRAGQKAAAVARDTQDKMLLKRMVDTLDEARQIKAAADDALAARDALRVNSADTAAAAAWGRFCCVYKGDWETGLPLLAAASGDLSELAREDQRKPSSPAEQAQLGDKWWDAATAQTEPLLKKNLQTRAVVWYRLALPWLSANAQSVVGKRIEQYDQGDSLFPLGEWVDVLAMIDPQKHAVRGQWLRTSTELGLAQPVDAGRCTIPVMVEGSYDLEVRFTMLRGVESNLVLPVGGRNCVVIVGGWGGRIAGLAQIDGRAGNQNTSTAKHAPLQPRQQQRLFCQVRVTGSQASIEVELNSRPLIRWQGQASSLSCPPSWNIPNPQSLGLAAYRSAVTYQSARLKLVAGKATPL
jgi:hypothetical protein